MQHWVEFHTAYLLALHGTASATAEALGIHRSTVIRHIEALEDHIGLKLFYRHSKGYTVTESGQELVRSGKGAEHEYEQFLGRMALRRTGVLGELTVCTTGPISALLIETASRFRADYPDCLIKIDVREDMPTLELGEAHIALWPGAKPETLDYVVVPITEFDPKLFVSRSYIEQHGVPTNEDDLKNHAWVTSSADVRSLPTEWLRENLNPRRVVLLSNCRTTVFRAIVEGLGIGLMPSRMGDNDPRLVRVLPDLPSPTLTCWGVTHVDTFHTLKIKSFMNHLKKVGREWRECGKPELADLIPRLQHHEAR